MAINRTNIADHLVEYQLNMVGKTMAEAYKTDEWYHKWTMTEAQQEDLRAYAIPLIKKVFRCNKRKAESIFSWFILQFGLRIDNNNKMEDYAEEL
jgi:hypothetical protein